VNGATMPSLIVDASVAVKWFFQEPGSAQAAALQDEDAEFIAPDLIVAEIGNAAWKRFLRKQITAADAVFTIRRAPPLFSSLVSVLELMEPAMSLSVGLSHPIYDCFYLALARRENAPLVTADEAMIAAARKSKIKVRRI
jgi:predicted nucleic acid-binding protein